MPLTDTTLINLARVAVEAGALKLAQRRREPDPPLRASPGVPKEPRSAFWAKDPAGVFIQVGEPGPWERVTLAGIELPGYCAVRSSGKRRKVLTVAGPGSDREEILDVGSESSDVSIVCYMWTPYHLAQFEDLFERLSRRIPTGTRARDAVKLGVKVGAPGTSLDSRAPAAEALDIVHPGLNLLGISSVYVKVITVPEPSSVRGVMESTIVAQEFAPEAKKPKAPKGQKSSGVIHVESSISSIPTAINTAPAAPAAPSETEAGP
jgi:hypothetical protein